jgi:hypothetical protein
MADVAPVLRRQSVSTSSLFSSSSSSSSSSAFSPSSSPPPPSSKAAAAASSLSQSLAALGGGRVLQDHLGYPVYDNGALVPPHLLRFRRFGADADGAPGESATAHVSASSTASPRASMPWGVTGVLHPESRDDGEEANHAQDADARSRTRRRNFVQENIKVAKEMLRVEHKLPPKIRIRAELPAEVFGENYKARAFKSKMQQSTEVTQRFMETFRASVADARERRNPLGDTSRDMYAPHFRAMWFPVLQPGPPPNDSPVRRSFELSGGLQTAARETQARRDDSRVADAPWTIAGGPGHSADDGGAGSRHNHDATSAVGEASGWKAALAETDVGQDASFLTEVRPTSPPASRTEATQQLYAFFDTVIRVGYNFLQLKSALRARDAEKVGFVSWEDFVAELEALHWQFRDDQVAAFKGHLEATYIVKPGVSSPSASAGTLPHGSRPPTRKWVVDYVNFVLSIRSWQLERSKAAGAAARRASGALAPDDASAGRLAQPGARATAGTYAFVGPAAGPAFRQAQARARSAGQQRVETTNVHSPPPGRRGRRSQQQHAVSITDPTHKIDPVLEELLRGR